MYMYVLWGISFKFSHETLILILTRAISLVTILRHDYHVLCKLCSICMCFQIVVLS